MSDSTPPASPLASDAGRVGLRHFDEGSGKTAADALLNNHPGLIGPNHGWGADDLSRSTIPSSSQ